MSDTKRQWGLQTRLAVAAVSIAAVAGIASVTRPLWLPLNEADALWKLRFWGHGKKAAKLEDLMLEYAQAAALRELDRAAPGQFTPGTYKSSNMDPGTEGDRAIEPYHLVQEVEVQIDAYLAKQNILLPMRHEFWRRKYLAAVVGAAAPTLGPPQLWREAAIRIAYAQCWRREIDHYGRLGRPESNKPAVRALAEQFKNIKTSV